MIRKSDVKWWALEARKHPEAAPEIIEQLAEHLLELDTQNEHLREELLHAEQRGPAPDDSRLAALQQEIAALRQVVARQISSEPALVLLSTHGAAVRLPISRVAQLARGDSPPIDRRALRGLLRVLVARPQERILLLSSRGRGWQLPALRAPALPEDGSWPSEEADATLGDSRPAAVPAPSRRKRPRAAAADLTGAR